MRSITARLTELLDLDVSRQRLGSTHVFSHMASFGRTRLMAVTIQRFLTQVRKRTPEAYESLSRELRERYEPAESRLFSKAKDAESRAKSRQQAAEDLLFVIEHFADQPSCQGYRTLLRVFAEHCEIVGDQVTVRTKTGGDCLQNPSDPDATYDGHKGQGYQVQLTETCSDDNEVQLITAALPQSACERDENSVVPMPAQLEKSRMLPDEMTADTAYGSDGNCQAAAALGVELIAPVAGRPSEADARALTVDDFAFDERTGTVEACPSGCIPLDVKRDADAGLTLVEMPAESCAGCPVGTCCEQQFQRRSAPWSLTIISWDQASIDEIRELHFIVDVQLASSPPDKLGSAAMDVALRAMITLGPDLGEFLPDLMNLLKHQDPLELRILKAGVEFTDDESADY
jgi:hypothetical protein